jgi:hypothetical protein
MGQEGTEGIRRASDEFADAVRDEAARFFDAVYATLVEQAKLHPEQFGLRPEPLSEEAAAAFAVRVVREYRKEQRDERKDLALPPDQEDIDRWVRMREDRRKAEDGPVY